MLRCSAFTLYGTLASSASGRRSFFSREVEAAFPSLVLHLGDPAPAVCSVRALKPLLSTRAANVSTGPGWCCCGGEVPRSAPGLARSIPVTRPGALFQACKVSLHLCAPFLGSKRVRQRIAASIGLSAAELQDEICRHLVSERCAGAVSLCRPPALWLSRRGATWAWAVGGGRMEGGRRGAWSQRRAPAPLCCPRPKTAPRCWRGSGAQPGAAAWGAAWRRRRQPSTSWVRGSAGFWHCSRPHWVGSGSGVEVEVEVGLGPWRWPWPCPDSGILMPGLLLDTVPTAWLQQQDLAFLSGGRCWWLHCCPTGQGGVRRPRGCQQLGVRGTRTAPGCCRGSRPGREPRGAGGIAARRPRCLSAVSVSLQLGGGGGPSRPPARGRQQPQCPTPGAPSCSGQEINKAASSQGKCQPCGALWGVLRRPRPCHPPDVALVQCGAAWGHRGVERAG